LGASAAAITTWKVHGLNGISGGLQGGLEAVVDDAGGGSGGLVSDVFWNVRPAFWSAMDGLSRVGSYGLLPGTTPDYSEEGHGLAAATFWRGRRSDLTGLVYMGARYYDPGTGRFLSPDPLGHASSASLYDYADGDPVNRLDPDGRVGKSWVERSMILSNSDSVSDRFSAMGWGLLGAGIQIPFQIADAFEQAGDGMAKARQEIGTYSGVDAFLARSLMLPADIAFGFSALVNTPVQSVAGIPEGLANFGSKIGTDLSEASWSINSAFNLAEDALGVFGLARGGTAVANYGTAYFRNGKMHGTPMRNAARVTPKLDNAANAVEDFLGGPGKIIKNADGDTILMRGDKKIRFDIKDPHGDKPHFHLEQQTPGGKWKDAEPEHRYYFKEGGQ
jgi:RHS repeat-associated protein